MAYDQFPAVNENFDFPIEIRTQLAKSEQLRNLVIPMSESARDDLTEEECWVGRTIFNTTIKALESFKEAGVWIRYIDSDAFSIDPPMPWNDEYIVPVEVRIQLAKSEQLRNMIVPMTKNERDGLPLVEHWSGRTIYNLTEDVVETWNSNQGSWVKQLNENYLRAGDEWHSWTPVLRFVESDTILTSLNALGRYVKEGVLLTAYFKISFTGNIENSATEQNLSLTAPLSSYAQPYIKHIGPATFDMSTAGAGRISGNVLMDSGTSKFRFEYTKPDGYAQPITNLLPHPWVSGCTIEGQIAYEIGG